MLFSAQLIETVADFLDAHRVPLVVDPVMVASSGAKLLEDDAVDVARRAPVSARDGRDAERGRGDGARRSGRSGRAGAGGSSSSAPRAAIVTGSGAGDEFFDGETALTIPVRRHDAGATHGSGCTHSATLAALLARGEDVLRGGDGRGGDRERRRRARPRELGAGEGPGRRLPPAKGAMSDSPGAALRDLRERKPLIHQITNYVVMNETANATLAIGALPVMAHAVEEVEEMASAAGALVLNIGTLSRALGRRDAARRQGGERRRRAGRPRSRRRRRDDVAHRDREADPRRGRRRDRARQRGRGRGARGLEAEIRGVEAIGVGGGRRGRSRARRRRSSASSPSVTGAVDHVSDGTRDARRRERRSAARDDHRLGLHVDRAHRLLRRGRGDAARRRRVRARGARRRGGGRSARGAQAPGRSTRVCTTRSTR